MTPRTRISVTIPPDLLEAADRIAAERARSRSWVVSEAVARYADGAPGPGPAPPAPLPSDAGLDPSRRAQLADDLELTPERRVLEAELTGRLSALRSGRRPRRYVVSFQRYDDYLDWKEEKAASEGP